MSLNAHILEAILHTLRESLSVQRKILAALSMPWPATHLQITWDASPLGETPQYKLKIGEVMPVTLNPGQTRGFTFSPLNAQGGASTATLSAATFATSDAAVFTVAADPTSPNSRGIVTAMTPPTTPDAAALTVTALATEPDGTTTETISGTDTVTVVTVPPPPPPPPVAASLAIVWDPAPASKK